MVFITIVIRAFITIVIRAFVNQLITGGPHLVHKWLGIMVMIH